MQDEPVKLRTWFQFTGIEERKEKLRARLATRSKLQLKHRARVTARVVEAYLGWLGRPLETKAVCKLLERRAGGRQASESAAAGVRVAAAVDMVFEAAEEKAGITVPLLQRLNAKLDLACPGPASCFRSGEATAEYPGHRPFAPEHVAGAVDRSIEWFHSEGVTQLHPLEQSVLCLTRLADIAPFARANLPTVALASSYYLVVAGFPPPAPFAGDRATLQVALPAATQMQTQPLIDLYVRIELEMLEE